MSMSNIRNIKLLKVLIASIVWNYYSFSWKNYVKSNIQKNTKHSFRILSYNIP